MAKKKELPASVALFDDEAPVIKKQEASKQTSKAAKKEVKKKTSKPSKETKSSPKEDKKPKKETKPTKKNVVDRDTAGNTSSRRNSTGNKRDSAKKEDKKDSGRKSKGASDTSKKSRKSSKADTENKRTSKQSTEKSNISSKRDKNNSVKGPSRRNKASSDTSTERVDTSSSEKQTVVDTTSTSFDEAKKRKHKFTRGSEIWPPKQITGKPKSIKDGELLAIIVDGEYLEVSPWSVKDGIYRQGMDSNFLVKYLYYEPVATKYDASNEELSNIIKKKEGK